MESDFEHITDVNFDDYMYKYPTIWTADLSKNSKTW